MRAYRFEDLWLASTVVDFAVSHDGLLAALVTTRLIEATNSVEYRLSIVRISDGITLASFPPGRIDRSPCWSPDARQIAFTSASGGDAPQLIIADVDGQNERRVIDAPLGVTSPCWSPDGGRIAYIAAVSDGGQRVPQEMAWIDQHPGADAMPALRRLRHVNFRSEGRGFHDRVLQLSIVDVATGETQICVPEARDHFEPAWSPDGARVAFVCGAATEAISLARDLCTFDISTRTRRTITDGTRICALPRWSPDATHIAFTFMPDLLRDTSFAAAIGVVRADGSGQRALAAHADRPAIPTQPDAWWPESVPASWSRDGQSIAFVASDGGACRIFVVDLATDDARAVSAPDRSYTGCAFAGASTLVGIATSPTRPLDLGTVQLTTGSERAIRADASGLAGVQFIEPERFRVRTSSVSFVDCWLYRSSTANAPMIVNFHGGPHVAWGEAFYHSAQAFSAAGYAMLYVNARGSAGYGSPYATAAHWGAEVDDILEAIDATVSRAGIDETRLGILGFSYGGFLANWTVGHVSRFRAAVSIDGIANPLSLYGTSDIGALYVRGEFGDPYNDPADWTRYCELAPVAAAERVHTPLLLLHGEDDRRVPIGQAEEFFTALRMRGRSAELVRFPGANHLIAMSPTPHHRYLLWTLARDWFDRYLA